MKNFNLKKSGVKNLNSVESKSINGGIAGWWIVLEVMASIVSGYGSGDLYDAM